MPYSEGAHSRLVASALATVSLANCYFPVMFFMLYRDMHLPQADLHGKTAIVTGANSGIGYECARSLASMGARVVLACRNENKGEEAMRNIVASTGNDAVEMEILDCGSFDSVRAFLDRWEKRESKRIDILINNAGDKSYYFHVTFLTCSLGSLTSTVALTPDGLEQTYQTSHLSHVLLTTTLLNRGHMSTEARIVSVSSLAFYESDPLDALNADNSDILSKYQGKVGTSITIADMRQLYKRSKAAQAIWTMVLQRQLAKTERWKNISVHSCHPGETQLYLYYLWGCAQTCLFIGTVKSPMYTQPGGAGSIIGREIDTIKAIVNVAGITNEQGAVVPVWLATAEEPNQPEFRGMFWDRLKWKWVWPWCLEMERQNELWDKWYKDAQVSLLT